MTPSSSRRFRCNGGSSESCLGRKHGSLVVHTDLLHLGSSAQCGLVVVHTLADCQLGTWYETSVGLEEEADT